MRRILLYPFEDAYLANRVFAGGDAFDTRRENVWRLVREKMLLRGEALDTMDCSPVETADELWFFNFSENRFFQEAVRCGLCNKMKLFIFEPPCVLPESWDPKNHQCFQSVYTWDDDLVGYANYKKFYWKVSSFQGGEAVPFRKKKLLTLVNAHKVSPVPQALYWARIEAIRFFEKAIPNQFDLYGIGWDQPPVAVREDRSFRRKRYLFSLRYRKPYFPSYCGTVRNKLTILSQYKFCLCYENMTGRKGYITEKIFDAFQAGCVPIYWGATNIQDEIPTSAFIDMRYFSSYRHLVHYLKSIDEERYRQYLESASDFLRKMAGKKWFDLCLDAV